MSIIGILKIMEVQEDDMEVQEEAVIYDFALRMGLAQEPWKPRHFERTKMVNSCLV